MPSSFVHSPACSVDAHALAPARFQPPTCIMDAPTPPRPVSLADEERTLHGSTPPVDLCPGAAPDQPPPKPPPDRPGPQALHLAATCSLLVFATLWGTLARLGLQWLGGFARRATFASVWAQVVGCFLMGLVQEKKRTVEAV